MNKEHLTPEEAAKYLGLSVHTLAGWRSEGRGPKYFKPEGTIFYMKSDLDKWIKSGEVK